MERVERIKKETEFNYFHYPTTGKFALAFNLKKDDFDYLIEKIEQQRKEIEHLREDENKGYDILSKVRDILLDLVNPNDNVCGDMLACTVSNPKCVECLAKQIRKQIEER